MAMAGAILLGCAGALGARERASFALAALAATPAAGEAGSGAVAAPARAYPGRAARAPRAGFGVQYWGEDYTAAGLAAAPHCALILEASFRGADDGPGFAEARFDAAEVAQIRRDGARPAYAYLNLAELAPHRDYWTAAFGPRGAPPAPGAPAPDWFGGYSAAGEPLAAYWTEAWAEVLEAQIDALAALGYDGVFLDDLLHYYTWADPGTQAVAALPAGPEGPWGLADHAEAMMQLVLRLAARARTEGPAARPDFAVLVNGGPFIGWDAATRGPAPEVLVGAQS
jgi:uncharacterized protein (TIGR01370 family)